MTDLSYAPVVIFAYNRPVHFAKTIASLQRNPEAASTDLIIYSDGPKNAEVAAQVEEVRAAARQVSGFKSVTLLEKTTNTGLANSIIQGITDQFVRHEMLIVLEDDMIVAPGFLAYMNAYLSIYKDEPRVASIHGYCYAVKKQLPDTFFIRGADCWGWATWRRVWEQVSFDGPALLKDLENRHLTHEFNFRGAYNYTKMLKLQISGRLNSWAIRWHASNFLQDKLTLYPGSSLVQNIGNDGSGTHFTTSDNSYNVSFGLKQSTFKKIPVEISEEGVKAFVGFFRRRKISTAIRKIRNLFSK